MASETFSKLERLQKLREDARVLELELQQEAAKQRDVGSIQQASHPNTPRQTSIALSRLPRRHKAAAASTNRVVKLVKDQICANYNTIQVHFNRNDTDNTGRIDEKDLVNVMERCNIPMTEQQASEIFKLLESDDQGRILYRDFLAIFYVQMPLLDGTADRPFSSIHAASAGLPSLSRMHTPLMTAKSDGARPQTKRDPVPHKDPNVYGGNLSSTRVALLAQLNEFVRDFRFKLDEMFEMSDIDSRGSVSKYETVRIFVSAGIPLSIEELDDVLEVVSEKAPKGYVTYKSFLAKLSSLTFDMPEIFESLTSVHFAPTHLYHVVGNRIRDQYQQVLKSLRAEDKEGTGLISKTALLRIVKSLGIEISSQALLELLRTSGVPHANHVNAHHLIQRFVPSHRVPSAGQYARRAEQARVPKEIANAPSMNAEQLLEKLKEKMEDHIKYPREMFLKLDTDKDGTLTKEELEKAFLYFNLYPTSADVDSFFNMVDVHKKGRIAYADFLKVLVPKGDHKPSTHHDSFRSYMRKGSFYSLVPQGVAPIRLNTQNRMTPVGRLSLADVQQVMMKKLKNQQKNLQMLLQQRDPDGTGYISKSLLLQVLRKLDVFIMHPQLEEVLEAQDIASQGDKVKHSEFLAKFLNAKQVGTETNVAVPVGGRQGSQTHRPFSTKVPQDTNELLQRIRAKLRGRWEDLQKAFFHEQDQALDFKVGREELARILHVFGVPITQDQSKILFENLGDSMDYSDFVRLLDTGSRRPTATKRLPTGNLTAREYRTRGAQVEIISRPATSRVLKA